MEIRGIDTRIVGNTAGESSDAWRGSKKGREKMQIDNTKLLEALKHPGSRQGDSSKREASVPSKQVEKTPQNKPRIADPLV